MKKSLLIALACSFLFSLTVSAQITKGSVLLGGGISGGKGKSEGNNGEGKSSGFSVYPAFGVAVKDNVVIGLRLSYANSSSEYSDPNNQNSQDNENYGAGIFYRRYLSLSQKFFLFGEGAVYYNRGKQESSQLTSKSTQTSNSFGVNFYPGIAYAVSKKIHLEVGLNNLLDLSYNTSKSEYVSGSSSLSSEARNFGFATNVSASAPLTVGFRFVLGK
ncbi:MAG TPA: outer membrane beta-barrel protein [Flavisolibacter sp.]|nr:outer membrane beta-barrel protein [Flavisolibacter sp.]